jgi:hypothetical protein
MQFDLKPVSVTNGKKIFAVGSIVVQQVIDGAAVVQAHKNFILFERRAGESQFNKQVIKRTATPPICAQLQRAYPAGVRDTQRSHGRSQVSCRKKMEMD